MNIVLKTLTALTVAAVLAILVGCASTSGTSGGAQDANAAGPGGLSPEEANANPYGTRGDGASATPYGGSAGSLSGQNAGSGGSSASGRVVYFDFDSDQVRAESRVVIESNARYLASNPSLTATLEGHADERGTREYNIGLGDRRGEAVRRLMLAQGVSPRQLNVVSYGEERPAATGHDEASYGLNRRVEIAY